MNVLTPNNSNKLKYSLKIGLFNARSLCNKIALVTELIHENNVALLCVTETWLKVKDKAKVRELHELGFDIFSTPRAGRGGVSFSRVDFRSRIKKLQSLSHLKLLKH